MYKKTVSLLFLMNCVWILSLFCVKGQGRIESMAQEVAPAMNRNMIAEIDYMNRLRWSYPVIDTKPVKPADMGRNIYSRGESIETYKQITAKKETDNPPAETEKPGKPDETLDKPYQIDEEQLEVLHKIVEAEAGCEDIEGKLLVANVVLNRVNHEDFPDTIKEVVYQKVKGTTQFSPVGNGRINHVSVSEETKEAVSRALEGEDISEGALYFAARKYADSEKMKWFDENLEFLFQHGAHEFFK